MTSTVAERVLVGLNDEQMAAVTDPSDLLVIRAGAGSGKTRVLTRRIAHGVETDRLDPNRVLALTFTRRAAGELNERLRRLGLRQRAAAGTFHSIALAQLRQLWEQRSERPPTLLDRKFSFVARLLPPTRERSTPLDVVAEIEWAKARRIAPEAYAEAAERAERTPPFEPDVIAGIYERYEQAKTDRRLIDFDDILVLCGRHLQQDHNAAEAFRWRFRHVFVDEFQDVNPLQFALLKVFVGADPELCVVGDSRQAIYGWNGADSSYLDRFEQHFPGARSVELVQNYRSTPEILRCASAVLPDQPALVPTRAGGPAPSITGHTDDRAEARAIARQLRRTHSSDRRWSDMAVLVRTNAQVALLAEEATKLDVPVRARGDANLLERPEVKDAIDDMSRSGPELSTALDDLTVRIGVVDETDGENDETNGENRAHDDDSPRLSDERRAVVESFIRMGRDHLALDPSATVESFLSALRSGQRDQVGRAVDAVDVTTFHAAKGLEWDVVHVAGLERGLAPIGHAKTPEAVAEEHRLVYVALTRAEHELHVHWAQERTFGDRTSSRSPSPLLEPIRLAARGEDPRSRRARSAAKAGAVRSRLRSTDGGQRGADVPDDDPVLVALKEWRLSVARANDVPAYVVFHDATLQAIAADRPDSADGLAAVPGIGPVKLARYGDDLLRVVSTVD